jgi:hypothetical protein
MERDKPGVAKAFCNDALTFNQQGCASPKLVYWCGAQDDVETARGTFWPAVEQSAAETPAYSLEAADAVNRLVAACSVAIDSKGLVAKAEASNHAFTRLLVSCLDDLNRQTNTGNGLFYEYAHAELDPLLLWFGDSDQTVTSHGISRQKWVDALSTISPRGICRIMPFGRALDFSPVWDGYDLVRYLSREIVVEV